MTETLGSLADDVVIDANCVRAIVHTQFDLEHQYMNCRTPRQVG